MDVQKLKAFAGMAPAPVPTAKAGMKPAAASAMQEMMRKAVEMAEESDEIASMLRGFDPAEDEAPEGVLDMPLFERAVAAVDPEGKGKGFDEPYAVALALYKLMGGRCESYEAEESDEDEIEDEEE
jgi:hypothetical protein